MTPYCDEIKNYLISIIKTGTPENQIVVGQALMCAGQLASAVGGAVFGLENLEVLTKLALEAI